MNSHHHQDCPAATFTAMCDSWHQVGAVPTLHVQDKCSLLQLDQVASCMGGASISLKCCRGHQGVMHLKSGSQGSQGPASSIKALKCTNCSGCDECREPVPLVIPEGTGGSGCSDEVAAKAEALRQALFKSSAGNAAGGGTQSGTDTLVECAVCHRKPGDPGVPATLKLCGGCRTTRYCSSECQKKDWKMGHKEVCSRFSLVRSMSASATMP
jgi:hypothetical protein